jgi:hypothetical protein
MHAGIRFDKILPKQVRYLGTRITGKQPKKFLFAAPRLSDPRLSDPTI